MFAAFSERAAPTYVSGAEPERLSTRDLASYEDSGVNWRVTEGYGAAIVSLARDLNVRLGCAVTAIDHGGRRLRIESTEGTIWADKAIVTLPSRLIAEGAISFRPLLPNKRDAAASLALGLDKLFLSLENAEELPADLGAIGRTDTSETAAYHIRPFGRPIIQAVFAGSLAKELERQGEGDFLDFAVGELAGMFGSSFASRVEHLGVHRWGADLLAGGSYSYASPGAASARALLSEPIDDRIFFAGEACSPNFFSTAHGAYATGVAAAQRAAPAT